MASVVAVNVCGIDGDSLVSGEEVETEMTAFCLYVRLLLLNEGYYVEETWRGCRVPRAEWPMVSYVLWS